MFRLFLPLVILLMAMLWCPVAGATEISDREIESIELFELPAVDEQEIRLADERRAINGRVPHYAVSLKVEINPWKDDLGDWQMLRGAVARWRLRLRSPGASSLNLTFGQYRMPPGGRLYLTSTDGSVVMGPFTASDNEEHGELWTPPMLTDDLILELFLPEAELDDLELELSQVQHGYAGFGDPEPKSGACHRDIVCSEAKVWSDQARSVALISVAGTRFCTGFLVNNTALDGRPYFLTASHCGVTTHNAASVVVMWNHERNECGAEEGDGKGDGPREAGAPAIYRDNFQTGAIFRASHRPSDMVLLELDDLPDPDFGVFYSGWDRSSVDPAGSAVIHHPNTDVKRISFDFDRATTTSHLSDAPQPGGNHLRIGQWEIGSTEGGSSGAPLFNRQKRVVGLLHGGYAACAAPRADWFGRLSAAWEGRGRLGFRLSDWLDPLATGVDSLDGVDGSQLKDRLLNASE